MVIAVNKWDIANRKEALQKLNDKLQTSLAQIEGVPTVTISALKNENLDKLMSAVFKVYDRWNTRIPTAGQDQAAGVLYFFEQPRRAAGRLFALSDEQSARNV
mgnify:CR=1 FL=1